MDTASIVKVEEGWEQETSHLLQGSNTQESKFPSPITRHHAQCA